MEDEEYFLFVLFNNRKSSKEEIDKKTGKIILEYAFLIKSISTKFMGALGDKCIRVPVDFDTLTKNEIFVVILYYNYVEGPYYMTNDYNKLFCFDTKEKAEKLMKSLEAGGYKEYIKGKDESFAKVEMVIMPPDKL